MTETKTRSISEYTKAELQDSIDVVQSQIDYLKQRLVHLEAEISSRENKM